MRRPLPVSMARAWRPPPAAKVRSLVILLHGYGSNGADLISLSHYWRGLLPHTAFVSPNAPQMLPGMRRRPTSGGRSPALSPASAGRAPPRPRPSFRPSSTRSSPRHGLDESRLALVGFSQGTMMSLHAAASRERPVAGVVGFSGMVADDAAIASARSKPPVLLIHGDADPMIPIAAFHRAKTTLESAGFPLATHVSQGLVHSIDAAGLHLAGGFLARSLSGA